MIALVVGFFSGYLSGLFGLGGGLIAKPALRLILNEPALIVVGTPLLLNIPSAIVGASSYGRRGYVAWKYAVPLALSGMVGVLIGATLTPWLGGSVILLATAAIIFVLGWRFIFKRDEPEPIEPQSVGLASLALGGAAIGLASGLLGLGGGFLLVPFLRLRLGLDMKTTFGTSLAIVGAITIPGAAVHYSLGHIDLQLGSLLVLGVIPGAYLGSKMAMRLKNTSLQTLFGAILVAAAVSLGYFELAALGS